jgi:hypothetical protein
MVVVMGVVSVDGPLLGVQQLRIPVLQSKELRDSRSHRAPGVVHPAGAAELIFNEICIIIAF